MIEVNLASSIVNFPKERTLKMELKNNDAVSVLLNLELKCDTLNINEPWFTPINNPVFLNQGQIISLELNFNDPLFEMAKNNQSVKHSVEIVVTDLKTGDKQKIDFDLIVEENIKPVKEVKSEPNKSNEFVLVPLNFQVITLNELSKKEYKQGTTKCFFEILKDQTFIKMLLIPEGNFTMGAHIDEYERQSAEFPNRKVTIHMPFFMSETPVTQKQWVAIMNSNPSRFKDEKLNLNLPVENVSWYAANEFCQKLSELANRTYRLPSEAEWEYTARGGVDKQLPFHFGKTILADLANYDGTKPYKQPKETGIYRQKTTPVGEFKAANNFGLLDIHGNVWEWCQDNWQDNYQNAPLDGSVSQMNNNPDIKVVRGGSWKSPAYECRSAFRGALDMDLALPYVGFRVVCVVD